jgi:histidyl-tRNA synthetase
MNRSQLTAEQSVPLVRGTRDWLPGEFERLRALEGRLLDQFARAGYEPMRTPVLEPTELHERKSGAGIVGKLIELGGPLAGSCLRPELTAGVVRAYAEAEPAPDLPWRVSVAGPVFRHEPDPDAHRLREFTQVGVELLGAAGPAADAEVIALADASLRAVGLADATIRVGHVGLILEMLGRSGLPPAARSALVEMLSEAAAEGRDVRALDASLDRLADWLRAGGEAEEVLPAVGGADDRGVDRLFRHLVPDVTGRRTGHEIIGRLRRKWDLAHSLGDVLEGVRATVSTLAGRKGPMRAMLDAIADEQPEVSEALAELYDMNKLLTEHGIAPERLELDLGFGRGIGFYSRMVFELRVATSGGMVEVGGGGRYDGLARALGSDRDDRGVGFAFGLERLFGALREARP